GTDFANPRLAGFTPVPYRGAFDPALPMDQQWTALWTNFQPELTSYVTSAGDGETELPRAFSLGQNYPNPFNPSTTIRFTLGRSGPVRLAIYNLLGRQVSEPVRQVLDAGSHAVEFSADGLASGVYLYRLSADGMTETRTMLLLR
ncbi:MAG: T9SS type A sorting domain-containing protein, partial [Bacteroidota bacterium]